MTQTWPCILHFSKNVCLKVHRLTGMFAPGFTDPTKVLKLKNGGFIFSCSFARVDGR